MEECANAEKKWWLCVGDRMEDQIGKAGMKDSGKAMRLARRVDADWIALSAFLVVSGAERKMGERWAIAARVVGGMI